MAKKKSNIVRFEDVRDRIVTIRGKEVILDFAVAELYGTETKETNRAVKNNPRKFPEGWIFELEKQELEDLRWKFSTADMADNQIPSNGRRKNQKVKSEDINNSIYKNNRINNKKRKE